MASGSEERLFNQVEEAFDESESLNLMRAVDPFLNQSPPSPPGPEASQVTAVPEDRPPHNSGAATLDIPID